MLPTPNIMPKPHFRSISYLIPHMFRKTFTLLRHFHKAFSVLYGIARYKDALIVAHLDFASGSLQWDVSFIRAAHNWEVKALASFFTLLYSIRVRREGKTRFGGPLLTKASLMLDPSIRSFLVNIKFLSLGRVFGIPQLWPFSLGWRLFCGCVAWVLLWDVFWMFF